MNLAYRYVSLAVLIAEANYIVGNLQLPQLPEVNETNLVGAYVAPEFFGSCTGTLDTRSYSFGFSDSGEVRYVWKRATFDNIHIAERNTLLFKQAPVIDTNDAYHLASNWLSALHVDVHALETSNAAKILREFQWEDTTHWHDAGYDGPKKFLPLFEIKWGGANHDEAMVEIDGRGPELLRLRVEDENLIERPGELLTNRIDLFVIGDKNFLNMSDEQRYGLIKQFGRYQYANPKPYPLADHDTFPFQSNKVFIPLVKGSELRIGTRDSIDLFH
jgi:hypothetical protein